VCPLGARRQTKPARSRPRIGPDAHIGCRKLVVVQFELASLDSRLHPAKARVSDHVWTLEEIVSLLPCFLRSVGPLREREAANHQSLINRRLHNSFRWGVIRYR
jgi:hypothetical protein